MLLHRLLQAAIRTGTLGLTDHRGRTARFGDGREPRATIRMHDPSLAWTVPLNATGRLPEAYMDGTLTIEEGTLRDVVHLFALNQERLRNHPLARLVRRAARARQYNPAARARRNAAHHYDLNERLYRLFLDEDMQYSCAYFVRPDASLEEAQLAKKRLLAAKLLLDRPGLAVLDVGSGWGGLALFLAREAGCDVTGVTLSAEQHRVSVARASRAGVGDRVRFLLKDYREIEGRFDRIVSVGMFEHVGKANYDEFFRRMAALLSDDGVAVIHFVGRLDEPGPINPFIRKYIFPGADVPCLSEVMPAVERSGLLAADIEVLRLHYAETLRHWHERFLANRARIADLYDERFCRMWELYLLGCEYGFRHQGNVVFQLQVAKHPDTVPQTRDYVLDAEPSFRCQPRASPLSRAPT